MENDDQSDQLTDIDLVWKKTSYTTYGYKLTNHAHFQKTGYKLTNHAHFQKSEDYYTIIKRPMDLETISKNVEALLFDHFNKFKKKLIQNRRQSQQRIRRRQHQMQGEYLRRLLEIQNEIFMQLPFTLIDEKRHKPHPKRINPSPDVSAAEDEPKFWENIVTKYTDSEFVNTFRMSRQTFRWLCEHLEEALKPIGTSVPLKNLIGLEKRIAISVYTLATGADYRVVADLFSVSRTSVCKFIKRFADAVVERLSPFLLAMPETKDDYDLIRTSFQTASNMPPLVVGCLGFTEINISPNADDITSFTNSAGNATIILQALIDDKLLFRKVSIDSKQPKLFLTAPNEITKLEPQIILHKKFPSFVVCPTDYYPLRSWLMRKYAKPKCQREYEFNEAIDNVLFFETNAFRRLYGRWKILQRKCDLEPKTMEVIATACCALHNLLEENEDGYNETWSDNVDVARFSVGHFKKPRDFYDYQDAINMRDDLSRIMNLMKR